ncbi:retrovirus-related pol polyprotein from transposon TNT 1-94 [Tanacetum coccineum]
MWNWKIIQDKVFVITSLKNGLQKLKGKEIVDIAAQMPFANTIVPSMIKLDLEPLAPSQETLGDLTTRDRLIPKVNVFLIPVIGRTKDEAPEAIIKCIKNIQVRLNATVHNVGTDNGTEFVKQTLCEFYENVGISHQTSVARTPQQNGVVKRRNRTLIEVVSTMLIFSKAPLFLWAEAINTSCYTQNHSIIRRRYNKTPYGLMQDKKPDLSFFHVFGALCYPTNDNDNLGKLDAKADICIFVGYARKESIHNLQQKTQKVIETMINIDD